MYYISSSSELCMLCSTLGSFFCKRRGPSSIDLQVLPSSCKKGNSFCLNLSVHQAGMKVFFVLALLAIGRPVPVTAWAGSLGCLCTFGQSCWPSTSTFSQLQSLVSQPLVYPLPSASACYPPSDPSGNCTAVLENWYDGNGAHPCPDPWKQRISRPLRSGMAPLTRVIST
jgi:hypothetical protein